MALFVVYYTIIYTNPEKCTWSQFVWFILRVISFYTF